MTGWVNTAGPCLNGPLGTRSGKGNAPSPVRGRERFVFLKFARASVGTPSHWTGEEVRRTHATREEGSGYWRRCGPHVLVRRQPPNHVLHLLLTLFLCFLWFPFWLLIALFGKGLWDCSRCGPTDV